MSEIRQAPLATTTTRSLSGGASVDAHQHDDHQIVFASRGVLSVTTDAGVWIASANRAIWVPAGTWHRQRAYGPTALHLVGVPATLQPLPTAGPTVIAVSPLLREVLVAYADEHSGRNNVSRRRLRAVLLDELHAAPEEPLHIPTPHDPRLRDIATVLDTEPDNKQNLADLAARIGSSERTVSRLCRDELGMSYPQWRTQLRLHHALILLAHDLPISVIADRCGWSSTSAFINTFHRALGYTPGRHKP